MKTPQVRITHISSEPRHVQAIRDFNELASALAKVQGRINEIDVVLHAAPAENDTGHVAAALEFAATGKVRGPENAPGSLSAERSLLRQQESALKNAMEMQRHSIEGLTAELSSSLCAGLEDAHRAIAAELLQKLRDVDALFERERTLINEIESKGYSVRFKQPLQWPYMGTLAMREESAIYHKVRELEGYVG